jgi:CheY-like chemotaxis protein
MKKKILLVEDDPSAAEILSLRLRDAGYGVAVAPNGVKGLEIAIADKPDMVVTDVWMPLGMGFALAYRLRQPFPNLPILFLTGSCRPGVEEAVKSFGCARLLQKPYETPELLGMVSDMLPKAKQP